VLGLGYFKRVQNRLYDFKNYPHTIKNLQDELDEITYKYSRSVIYLDNMGSGLYSSNVEHYLVMKEESKKHIDLVDKLHKKKREYLATKAARESLLPEERDFVIKHYDLEWSSEKMMHHLNISERTYFRYKQRILRKVGMMLGWM
jgi:hypothetical protein